VYEAGLVVGRQIDFTPYPEIVNIIKRKKVLIHLLMDTFNHFLQPASKKIQEIARKKRKKTFNYEIFSDSDINILR